jgi:hypothetical protein
MKKIATLTTYTYLQEKFSLHINKKYKTRDSRVVGFFETIKKAKEALIDNAEGLYENSYEYAVIEFLEEGLYPKVISEEWFKYDKLLDVYTPCLKPIDFKHTVNFSIG